MARHIGRGNRPRKVILQLPPLFTEIDKHGAPMSIEKRRWLLPVPSWAESIISSFRPSTREFSVASDRIAEINYSAYKKSKKTYKRHQRGWDHYLQTTPSKTRSMHHPLKGVPSKKNCHSEPTIVFKTSWLEPIIDEEKLNADFEKSISRKIPEVRTLLRTTRRKQKEWDKKCSDPNKNPGAKKLNRNKPQKWIPRNDPCVKIDKVQKWLEKHGETTLATNMKKETVEALKKAPQFAKRRRKRQRGKTKIEHLKSKQKSSYFLGSSSSKKDNMGWFDNNHNRKTGKSIELEKLLLERLDLLERKHKPKSKHLHCRAWKSTSSQSYVPRSFIPLEASGIISGGRRFNYKTDGRKTMNPKKNKYVSPLLLPHERD
jgi:hypothetical protein